MQYFVYLQVKGMITDFGEDMHCQFLEILRSLLDSYTLSGAQVHALTICYVFDLNFLLKFWCILLMLFEVW